jgi:hypothetical protein
MTTPEDRERESRESDETKFAELREEDDAARRERVERLGEELQQLKERADDESGD